MTKLHSAPETTDPAHRPDPNELTDWDEQDLLTIDEAGARLRDELEHVRGALETPIPDSARQRLQLRLGQLQACLAGITSGPTSLGVVADQATP